MKQYSQKYTMIEPRSPMKHQLNNMEYDLSIKKRGLLTYNMILSNLFELTDEIAFDARHIIA